MGLGVAFERGTPVVMVTVVSMVTVVVVVAGMRQKSVADDDPSATPGGALFPQKVNQVIHPTPYTLHPSPCTLHPTPYTLHSTPYTLHPTPYTLDQPGHPLASGERTN